MGAWVTTTNAEAYITPEPKKSGGFLNWLSGNYGEVTDSVRDIACLFKPETCAGGASNQPAVIVQQEDSAKTYFLIIGVLIVLVLIVLLAKR